MGSLFDITGEVYSRLTVLSRAGRDRHGNAKWVCQCECGNIVTVLQGSLRSKNTQSCGCLQRLAQRKHGNWNHPLYKIWNEMMRRCYSPKCNEYHNYGGRGITVDERWHDLNNFIADMHPRPSDAHSIEREDNNGPYRKSNVVWATQKAQCRNKRTNRLLTYKGETLCCAAWAERIGMKNGTLHRRLQSGWTVERALETPLIKGATNGTESKG